MQCGIASGKILHAADKSSMTYSVWQIALMKHQQLVGMINQSCVCCLKAILHINIKISVHSVTSLCCSNRLAELAIQSAVL